MRSGFCLTFAATALLSLLCLSAPERLALSKQLLGGLTFTTNFVLWRQIDYFNPTVHFKPLLHIWSLAVEEQFYLLLPAALFILPRRFWLRFVLLYCGASAVLCFVMVSTRPRTLAPLTLWCFRVRSRSTSERPEALPPFEYCR